MPKETIDIALLERVKSQIEAYPRSFDMHVFYSTDPECGTIACIAGHTLFESGFTYNQVENVVVSPNGEEYSHDCDIVAQGLLGLSYEEARHLFYVISWPQEYHVDLTDDNITTTALKIIQRVIDEGPEFLTSGK